MQVAATRTTDQACLDNPGTSSSSPAESCLWLKLNVEGLTDGSYWIEYNDFDIILGPFPACHSLFTALHAPCDVSYLVTMVIGC